MFRLLSRRLSFAGARTNNNDRIKGNGKTFNVLRQGVLHNYVPSQKVFQKLDELALELANGKTDKKGATSQGDEAEVVQRTGFERQLHFSSFADEYLVADM